jgi:tetratricopeptide (TPR) repeat protein
VHSFLWQGKDSSGKKRGVRVEAEDAQSARAFLVADGWTELQLIRDEISDVSRKQHRAEAVFQAPELTPDQEISRYLGRRPSFFSKWWTYLRNNNSTFIWLGLVIGLGIYAHQSASLTRGGIELFVIVLLFPILYLFYSQSRRNYARLNRAKVDGRWDEVLKCVERLRRSRKSTRIGVSEVELARNYALALAHLGRLDEAVAEFRRFENSPNLAHWLYCSHLAGIYKAGRQFDRAVEMQLQLVAEKPGLSAGWIDLAGMLVKKLKRPAEAREALARAAMLESTPIAKPHVLTTEGVILWREGKLAEARDRLEQALTEFKPFAHKPLVKASILSAKSYLCAVNRALGNEDETRKLFAEVKKYLVAHQEDELLQACRVTITRGS